MAKTLRQEGTGAGLPPTVQGALIRLGMRSPSFSTVVVTASATTAAAPDVVWKTWSQLDKWSQWSKPLHVSARWLEKRDWEVGAKFEQIVSLGFPLGKSVSLDTVKEVNPGQSVAWWKTAAGVKSCHIWFFEATADGGTTVTKTEIFVGMAILISKCSGAGKRWKSLFQASVDGLIKAAERPN